MKCFLKKIFVDNNDLSAILCLFYKDLLPFACSSVPEVSKFQLLWLAIIRWVSCLINSSLLIAFVLIFLCGSIIITYIIDEYELLCQHTSGCNEENI